MSHLQTLSVPSVFDPSSVICVWGDSTVNGTGAATAADIARSVLARAFEPDRLVINLGIGGEPPSTIAQRYLARAAIFRDAIHILWFGRADYSEPATDFTAWAHACWAARDHDRMAFLVPAPGANANEQTPGSPQITINNDARGELIAAHPDHHIDQMQAMWDDVTGADTAADQAAQATGYCPPKYLADDIHRNSAGQLIEATAMFDFITAKGW